MMLKMIGLSVGHKSSQSIHKIEMFHRFRGCFLRLVTFSLVYEWKFGPHFGPRRQFYCYTRFSYADDERVLFYLDLNFQSDIKTMTTNTVSI